MISNVEGVKKTMICSECLMFTIIGIVFLLNFGNSLKQSEAISPPQIELRLRAVVTIPVCLYIW